MVCILRQFWSSRDIYDANIPTTLLSYMQANGVELLFFSLCFSFVLSQWRIQWGEGSTAPPPLLSQHILSKSITFSCIKHV